VNQCSAFNCESVHSLLESSTRHCRKTLPPDVFKCGPLPNAHITSESHCHWHITCKIDWKIHALHKKSLYTAQLSIPKHKRITTKNSYASMSLWRWSYFHFISNCLETSVACVRAECVVFLCRLYFWFCLPIT